jgi:hypothetical protein
VDLQLQKKRERQIINLNVKKDCKLNYITHHTGPARQQETLKGLRKRAKRWEKKKSEKTRRGPRRQGRKQN